MRRTDIFDHCVPEPNTGCWLWTRAISNTGHSRFKESGGRHMPVLSAHRVALELTAGPPPTLSSRASALHRCDVPSCINPAHLYWGTETDNSRDRYERGNPRPRGMLWNSARCAKGHPRIARGRCMECQRAWGRAHQDDKRERLRAWRKRRAQNVQD